MTKLSHELIDNEFSKVVELEEQGRLEEAAQRLRSLIESGATAASAYVKLGGLLWELDQLSSAKKAFKEAVEKAPRWTAASLGLFHTLWQQNLRVDALEEAKRFTKLTGSVEYRDIVQEINERSRRKAVEDD